MSELSNEIVVVDKETIDVCDPHGYYGNHGRQEPNFKSPSKRSFLNECIRQIYILHGSDMSTMTIPVEFNRCLIWNTLNALMVPQRMSPYQASVQRVRRRLFRDAKQKRRKTKRPTHNNITETECYHYKPFRHQIGLRKIPRSYLEEACRQIYAERSQNLKRKHENIEPLHLATKEGVFQVSQQVINKVCRYHGNMARPQPSRERSMEEQIKRERNTEACRLSRRAKKLEEVLVEQQYRERLQANEKVLEASIRSILYMKALMGLMVNGSLPQDERNLYI
ncbi:uncharacterized protein LOC106083053 [Stomoxys calcitrans]|uniref:BZIP domain-containing protein n=1 Tax=Stomoxys calcitrans TaxID=35570 RepID=A0A1I8PEV8_STOCA|nr:uncharacterized protein LOC106083053 [Stomoxys calcitrans]